MKVFLSQGRTIKRLDVLCHREAGQLRVREQYTWKKCGDLIDQVYDQIGGIKG